MFSERTSFFNKITYAQEDAIIIPTVGIMMAVDIFHPSCICFDLDVWKWLILFFNVYYLFAGSMVPDKNGFPQWEFGKDWAWKSSYASRDLFLIISANSRIIITLNVYLEFPRWEFLLLVGEQLYSCCYCLVVNRLLNAMAWEFVSYLCMYYSSADITKFPQWEFCSLLFRRPVFSCFFSFPAWSTHPVLDQKNVWI